MAFNQSKYATNYRGQHYEMITVCVPKGAKADLKDYAQANDLSLNALILKALERQYHFDFNSYKANDGGAAE